MKERLISRVGRIISGSVNSLVDAIENAAPETVLGEAIREIEAATDEVRNELGKVVAKKHLASTKLMEENKKHEDLSEKIEQSTNESREALAEAAISRQLDIETQIPILEATIDDCAEQEKELENYVNALQAKKREMKEELIQFKNAIQKETAAGSEAQIAPDRSKTLEGKIEKAESVFDRVIENATGIPGKQSSSDQKTATQMAELEALSRKNKIQERLARIKKGI